MKKGRKMISLILVCVMLLAMSLTVAAEQSRERKRYNVVFVTDESGSMKYTDPGKLRYEAIGRFVALMAQHGNYLGSVTFDDGLMDSNDLQPMNGKEDKEAFMERIRSFPPAGDTNIGLALTEALNLLDKAENTDNPSVVILLSDGKTDLKDPKEMEASLQMKAEAIDRARKDGYKVYTICLNENGDADAGELRQIAEATGGEFREVKTAVDLKEVQTMYYAMIFGAINGEREQLTIGPEGYAQKVFLVPAIGVEEVNVILDGDADSYTMTDPAPYEYTMEELREMSMGGVDFVVIKKENPVGGYWTVKVYGKPGAKIDFQLLYNSDLYLTSSVTPESDFKLDQTVRFQTAINDRNGAVTDPEKYVGFTACLHLTVNGEARVIDMDLEEGGFFADVLLDTEGTYKVYMTVTDGSYNGQTEEIYELNINNNAPFYDGEPLKDRAYIWPLFGGSAVVDLADSAKDPDGNPLTYTVESSAFRPEDYTLEGSRLEVHNFSISKGSFVILATDPYGAGCTVPVEITSINIGLVAAITIFVGTCVALGLILYGIYRAKLIPFMGTITVTPFGEDNDASIPMTPSRGSIKLIAFGVGNCGFAEDVRFQAGGRDKKVYFKSKKPVYTTVASGAVKKIAINGNGLEVMIYADSTREKGICVKFASILNTGFGMDQF